MKSRISALLGALALASIATLGIPALTPSVAVAQQETAAEQETETKDIIILRSGTVVEGQILEETDTSIRFMVSVAGIQAPTTYRLADILEIQRDIPVKTDPDADRPEDNGNGWGDRPDDQPRESSGDLPRVYRFPMDGHIVGEFGAINYLLNSNRRDIISFTPVDKTYRDAMSHDPDIVIIELDADAPASAGWDGGFVAAPLQPIIEEMVRDPDIRLVIWVHDAQFGAAFLPFYCPEMYFESQATLGGIGTLDDFDIGDSMVNEKQISLRIGAAEGIAIKNGYNPAIIRGMARQQNWLCYRFRSGRVEFLEHEPRDIDGEGWVILTDDGEGDFKDEMETRGNDVLNLDAKTALDIGLSKGTYDDIDDLIFALGIRGEYELIEGRAERNYEEWRDRVQIGLDQWVQLNRDMEHAQGGRRGDSAVQVLGRQRRILREMRGLLSTYEEIFDPTGQQRAQIDIQLEQLRESIIQATQQERNQRRGRR